MTGLFLTLISVGGRPAAPRDGCAVGLGRDVGAGAPEPRLHRVVEAIPEDRARDAAPAVPVTERLSAEMAARCPETGQRGFFGDKGPVRTDGDGGVARLRARPANEGGAPHIPALSDGRTGRRVPPSRV